MQNLGGKQSVLWGIRKQRIGKVVTCSIYLQDNQGGKEEIAERSPFRTQLRNNNNNNNNNKNNYNNNNNSNNNNNNNDLITVFPLKDGSSSVKIYINIKKYQ